MILYLYNVCYTYAWDCVSTNILTDDDKDEDGESRCSGRARIGGSRPGIYYVL